MKHEPTDQQLNEILKIFAHAQATTKAALGEVIRHWESIRPSDEQTAAKLIEDLSGKLKEAQAEIDRLKSADPEDRIRDAFEAWAAPRGYSILRCAGSYVSTTTDNAWQGWKGGAGK